MDNESLRPGYVFARPNGGFLYHVVPFDQGNGRLWADTRALCGFQPSGRRGRWQRLGKGMSLPEYSTEKLRCTGCEQRDRSLNNG